MVDALRYDKHFWQRFSIDLTQINVELTKQFTKAVEIQKEAQARIRAPQKHGLAVNRIMPVEVNQEFSRVQKKGVEMMSSSAILSDPVDIDLDVE